MIEHFFCKIGTFLRARFSWKRDRSPNARSNQGHVAVTSGNESPIHIGNVHHHISPPKVEVTSYLDAWIALIKVFSPESAKKLVAEITDPRQRGNFQQNNLKGHKNFISNRFKALDLDRANPLAEKMNFIRTGAIINIDDLEKNGDKDAFLAAWDTHLKNLELIRDALLQLSL